MGSKSLTISFGAMIVASALACGGAAVGNSAAASANGASNAVPPNESTVTPKQEEKKDPPLSPPASAESTIGGKKITINYSAPSMRGRKIIGVLVPFDTVWRTGANAATTLITEADLKIGDLSVPHGTYTIYSLPSEKGWKLIVNKQTGQWGTEYKQDQDLGRIDMQVKPVQPVTELFKISIKPNGNTGGMITLKWENTEASVPFTVVP